MKYHLELRNDWPEISPREWERLETDEAFKEGFLLVMNNISNKIDEMRENWNKEDRNFGSNYFLNLS